MQAQNKQAHVMPCPLHSQSQLPILAQAACCTATPAQSQTKPGLQQAAHVLVVVLLLVLVELVEEEGAEEVAARVRAAGQLPQRSVPVLQSICTRSAKLPQEQERPGERCSTPAAAGLLQRVAWQLMLAFAAWLTDLNNAGAAEQLHIQLPSPSYPWFSFADISRTQTPDAKSNCPGHCSVHKTSA